MRARVSSSQYTLYFQCTKKQDKWTIELVVDRSLYIVALRRAVRGLSPYCKRMAGSVTNPGLACLQRSYSRQAPASGVTQFLSGLETKLA